MSRARFFPGVDVGQGRAGQVGGCQAALGAMLTGRFKHGI